MADRTFAKFTFFNRSRLAPSRRRVARRRQAGVPCGLRRFRPRSLAARLLNHRNARRCRPPPPLPEPQPRRPPHLPRRSRAERAGQVGGDAILVPLDDQSSPYCEEQARPEICVTERKYFSLYPMVKQRRWYGLPAEERGRIMKSHIEVGRRYPEITINTSYSFGIDDQEFVVASRATTRDVPRPGQRAAADRVERVHRARDADLHLRGDVGGKALDALDGTASAVPIYDR